MTGRVPEPARAESAAGGRVRLLGALLAAVGFLTALPVPEGWASRGHRGASAFFPLVGWALGAVPAALIFAVPDPLLGAALGIPALALLTGGLHWDGFADVMDAGLAPVGAERRREILSDSRVGAHAAWGVAALVLLQVVALSGCPWWAVALGPALGRWVMVASLAAAPALPGSSVGARFRSSARPRAATVLMAVTFGAFIVVVPAPLPMALAAVGAVAVAALAAAVLVGRLGGLNGDGHGAVGLVAETVFWVLAGLLPVGTA